MPRVDDQTRRYSSPRRLEMAALTRRSILAAARELFVEKGYIATTVDQIAERAGVSKPTVFASVGSKRVILTEVRNLALAGDDEPVPLAQRAWFQEALHEPDPVRLLVLHAQNVVSVHRRVADVNEVLRSSAGADEDLRQLWQTSEGERRATMTHIVDALLTKATLKAGLDRESAIDILWALTNPDLFLRFVRARRWSVEHYERWLAKTFIEQLLPLGEVERYSEGDHVA